MIDSSGQFDGQVAIVTGAASGIGRAGAAAFAQRGASVVVSDMDVEGGERAVAEIRSSGGEAVFVVADVAEPDAAELIVQRALDNYGRLDVAFNNAGQSGTFAPLPEQKLEDWNRVLAVNLTSVFLGMQAQIPAMLDSGGGAIVNTASAAGLMGFANLPAYVASKHGVIGLTKSIALEYARQNIRVNAVCPGMVLTKQFAEFGGGEAGAAELGAGAPIGRVGRPEEIAEVAAWLCSGAASFVTGHAMAVDGGVLAT